MCNSGSYAYNASAIRPQQTRELFRSVSTGYMVIGSLTKLQNRRLLLPTLRTTINRPQEPTLHFCQHLCGRTCVHERHVESFNTCRRSSRNVTARHTRTPTARKSNVSNYFAYISEGMDTFDFGSCGPCT